jgi:hypothetical protein
MRRISVSPLSDLRWIRGLPPEMRIPPPGNDALSQRCCQSEISPTLTSGSQRDFSRHAHDAGPSELDCESRTTVTTSRVAARTNKPPGDISKSSLSLGRRFVSTREPSRPSPTSWKTLIETGPTGARSPNPTQPRARLPTAAGRLWPAVGPT